MHQTPKLKVDLHIKTKVFFLSHLSEEILMLFRIKCTFSRKTKRFLTRLIALLFRVRDNVVDDVSKKVTFVLQSALFLHDNFQHF